MLLMLFPNKSKAEEDMHIETHSIKNEEFSLLDNNFMKYIFCNLRGNYIK